MGLLGNYLDAGFRPCRRGPLDGLGTGSFVSAKGPKTISACLRPQGGPSASALIQGGGGGTPENLL